MSSYNAFNKMYGNKNRVIASVIEGLKSNCEQCSLNQKHDCCIKPIIKEWEKMKNEKSKNQY